jgi:hypothetical protein
MTRDQLRIAITFGHDHENSNHYYMVAILDGDKLVKSIRVTSFRTAVAVARDWAAWFDTTIPVHLFESAVDRYLDEPKEQQ